MQEHKSFVSPIRLSHIKFLRLQCYDTFLILGAIKTDYTEKDVCIGNYPLSAALTCAKVCSAFEEAWGVF